MKIGDKVLVPNWIAFEVKSDAIAIAVINHVDGNIHEKMDGIYPNEFDMGNDDWKDEREYEVKDIFTLDDITIIQIQSNGKLLWIWKYVKNESE